MLRDALGQGGRKRQAGGGVPRFRTHSGDAAGFDSGTPGRTVSRGGAALFTVVRGGTGERGGGLNGDSVSYDLVYCTVLHVHPYVS